MFRFSYFMLVGFVVADPFVALFAALLLACFKLCHTLVACWLFFVDVLICLINLNAVIFCWKILLFCRKKEVARSHVTGVCIAAVDSQTVTGSCEQLRRMALLRLRRPPKLRQPLLDVRQRIGLEKGLAGHTAAVPATPLRLTILRHGFSLSAMVSLPSGRETEAGGSGPFLS